MLIVVCIKFMVVIIKCLLKSLREVIMSSNIFCFKLPVTRIFLGYIIKMLFLLFGKIDFDYFVSGFVLLIIFYFVDYVDKNYGGSMRRLYAENNFLSEEEHFQRLYMPA